MKLIPRELDKLKLSAAGVLAQRRLARGVRLNYPEAVALIAAQVSPYCARCGPAPLVTTTADCCSDLAGARLPRRSVWSSSATAALLLT